MTKWATPKLAGYAALSGAGLLTALVFARPELVALTAPFLLALAAGLALATAPRLTVHVQLDENRALEGDAVGARVVVESAVPVDRLDLYLRLPDGIEVGEGKNPVALHLPPQPNYVKFGGHKREMATWMLGLYRPLRLDGVAQETITAFNRELLRDPSVILEPNTMATPKTQRGFTPRPFPIRPSVRYIARRATFTRGRKGTC